MSERTVFYSELLRLIGENLGIAAMLIAFPLVVLARLWPYIRLMKRKSKDAP